MRPLVAAGIQSNLDIGGDAEVVKGGSHVVDDLAEFEAAIREERLGPRRAARAFADALLAPNWTALHAAVDRIEALGAWRTFQGGSVMVETNAPAEAILCAPHVLGDEGMDEGEYLVDRRRLSQVRVVRRYAQVPIHGDQV